MWYASFLLDGAVRCGVVRDEFIEPFPQSAGSLVDVIASSFGGSAPAREAAVDASSVTLLAPVHPAKNVFCVGRNYMGHAEEIARARGTELKLPNVPTFFTKAPTAIAAPDSVLELNPKLSAEYDYEAELGVVIGTRCKDVPKERALEVIFGYTCINDVTARDLQREHVQWFKGKSLDHTCPIGPWIVGAGDVPDPQTLDIQLRLNGETKQSSNTAHMIFSVAEIIASLSAGMTLEPGDVIATGTPDGVGFARTPPEFLTGGDVMEVEIAGIGVLRNTIAFTA